ncbi:MAG: helix-turn-helix domain-containing protein [Bacilli bacterium]|nr:helix-turn-helix domain-containing protein [Bacilli bacterium]
MNQEKIGKFIAKCRKDKNMTQQELADKLGLTYKAVSKWETGNGLPDVSLYKEICDILEISLNEFFAGEHLSKENMIQKSEENIMNIVKSENVKKKNLKVVIMVLCVIGFLLVSGLFGMYIFMKNYWSVSKTFKYNWNIIIPNDFKEYYHTETEPAFGGDGERYSIYDGSNFMIDFNINKNDELEEKIQELNEKLNIPKDKQINFEHKYQWKKINNRDDERDELYIIFDEELNKYYFYELFM